MSLTVENLRAALNKIDPGIRVSEFGNFMPYDPYWREPEPLPKFDPWGDLLRISGWVFLIVFGLILYTT